MAVKTARRHGKSWAEIATKLGVTRQSAWERWRDLDAGPGPGRPAGAQAGEVPPAELVAGAADALVERARQRRRQSTVPVPDVIGMPWEQARETLTERGLVAAGPDPDGLPLAILAQPGSVVTDQSPESGARVPPGSTIMLWLDRGDGGVREPRRPTPIPRMGRQLQPEPADQAIG